MNQSIAARKSETTRHDQGLICCRTCREVPWILVVWIWPRRMLRIQIFPKEIDASCAASSETCRCWTSEVSIDKHRRMTLKASCLSGKHLATRFETEIIWNMFRRCSTCFMAIQSVEKSLENNGKHSYEWPSHTTTWLHLQTWLLPVVESMRHGMWNWMKLSSRKSNGVYGVNFEQPATWSNGTTGTFYYCTI